MSSVSNHRSNYVVLFATLSVFFLLQPLPSKAQVGLRLPPARTPFAPLSYSQRPPVFSIGDSLSTVPIFFPRSFIHTITIDSTGQYVVAAQKFQNLNILTPRTLSLQDYLRIRSLQETQNQWSDYVAAHTTSVEDQYQRSRGITISTPRIKSQAFRRVFGGETLSLNVTGNITIDGNMRHEKRSQTKTAATRAPNTNFQMKQTQQFKVEGKIGENVSVFVDQDSERPFEFNNAFKLNYSSDEDGIIKRIEAGNVALSLPSTRFVTFSAQNSGLFGVKSEMKIGKLDITTIASMEKGEKKKLSVSGGAEEETYQIQDYEYKKATYFFLDSLYRAQYINLFDNGIHGYDPQYYISEIEVYKSDYNYYNKPDAIPGWAVVDPNAEDPNEVGEWITSQEKYKGDFIRLDPSEYYLNRELGFIVMEMSMQESEVLAVAYKDSSGNSFGTLLGDTTVTHPVNLFKLIKPRSARPSDRTWYLEWKNVYSLGGRDIDREGFELKIYFKPPSGDPQEAVTIDGTSRGYLNAFGLDNIDENGSPNPDNQIDIDPNILSLSRGELIFPNLLPFYPEGEESDLPQDKWTRAIYDTLNTSYIRQQSKFYMDVKSSRRSPTYSLGMNVIEGSEEVRLNGATLQKDKDYTIDYFSGNLTILREEATLPSADVEIDYESQRLFSVDKKSIFGARAEYTLWEQGANRSFLGATLLYFNQKTLDQRVRVGRSAPMKNLVWDVNTAMKFQPNFITKALDALPLLHVTGNSTISLEGEIAQVIPNPNTLNSESTGDPDGVAYLDDFEGARRQVSLGVIRSGWVLSSPPDSSEYAKDNLTKKGHLIWYNPYEQVAIQDIWPNREVTTNYGGTTRIHVLTMEFWPNDSLLSSWGGIQRSLSTAYADQTDSRFLEVWVQGTKGRLHVDLGQISEDVIPNQTLNTEDKRGAAGFLNNILDEDEDTGLDGMFGDDAPITLGYNQPAVIHPHEPASVGSDNRATPYDFWDLNGNGQKEENEPWSYDDWKYSEGGAYYSDAGNITGTENNRNDGMVIYPNSEDINRNGDVDLNNDFYEFSFSLDTTSQDTVFIAGGKGNPNGWRLYRIPLDLPTKVVGQPDWSRIEFARIWVDSVDQYTRLSIAEINLVGNEWKLRGVTASGDSLYNLTDDTTMSIAVINTHDNPEYTSPPGVEGVVDPIQKIRSKEQSLVIQLSELDTGSTAIAEKQFYQAESLINYHTLKMYVHGGDETKNIPSDGSIEFFLQWGSDTQNEHYYEVRLPVFPGWDERNNIEIDFEILSRLKIEMQALDADTISETQSNGHLITVVGEPSLTNVRWLIIGAKNKWTDRFTGEIWINELRVSGVRKDKGMAMRVSADIRLADFITINGQFDRKDADFHTVNERFGQGSNTLGGNLNASINLEKLLPAAWGISLPVRTNFSKSRQTPKYLPGSDILVNKNTVPDSLLKTIRTENQRQGLNVSFSKRTKSRNFWVRYLIDPIQSSFNYTRNDMSSSQIKNSTNIAYKGSFSYNLNFGDQNFWEPFKWMGDKGIFKKISGTKFYYLPSKINLQMSGNNNLKDSETRSGVLTNVETKNFARNFSTSLRPFKALSLDLTKTMSSDMRYAKWEDVFTSLSPGTPLSKTQNISTSFNPQIFSWLTPSVKYSSNYRWNDNPQMRSRGTGQSASVSTNFTISGKFDPGKLVSSFSKKSNRRTTSRPRRPVTRQKPEEKTEEKDDKQTDEEKKTFPLLSFLSLIGKGIEKIDPISISITETKSANNYGILGTPSFAYQIGSTLDPGVDYSENVTQRSSSKIDHRFSLRSGFRITSNMTASIDYEISNSKNTTTQTTGNIQKSTLLMGDKGIPFPNWTFQWRGLEKLPVVSKITRTMSLSHNFSGRMTTTWNDHPDNITQQTISRDFRPLVGFSFTLKNGINGNIQYNTTQSLTEQKKYSTGRTKRISSNLNISANYSMRGGIKLPFMKKKLENNIDLSIVFTKSYNATLQSRSATGEFAEMSLTKNWSFQPKLTYTFSRTVRGGMHLELGEREDLRAGKTKITGFGINAVISLAGS